MAHNILGNGSDFRKMLNVKSTLEFNLCLVLCSGDISRAQTLFFYSDLSDRGLNFAWESGRGGVFCVSLLSTVTFSPFYFLKASYWLMLIVLSVNCKFACRQQHN